MRFFFVHNKISSSPIDLSKFNTSKVTNIREMFYESQISNINLSSFDMSNVSEYEYMFRRSNAINEKYIRRIRYVKIKYCSVYKTFKGR